MTEQEIQAAIEKAVAGYRENTEREIRKFEKRATAKLEGRGEFSIETIEEIWGDILDSNKKVTEDLKPPCALAHIKNNSYRIAA
jgi:SOS response regulatory protein OraA/RecX